MGNEGNLVGTDGYNQIVASAFNLVVPFSSLSSKPIPNMACGTFTLAVVSGSEAINSCGTESVSEGRRANSARMEVACPTK